MNKPIYIRSANEQDASALAAIYAPYVANTSISFEYEPPNDAEFARRIREITAQFPYLVCEVDGVIAGYAYAHVFHERAAYQWDAELSIYIDENFHRMGIAAALCDCICKLLRAQGYLHLYSLIAVPNEASITFHTHMGFSLIGTYENAGFKLGEWHNVIVMERQLAPLPPLPEATVPFPALDITYVMEKIREAEEEI